MNTLVVPWDQLLYAFIEEGHCQAFQSFQQNVFPPLSWSLMLVVGQKFLEVEKQVLITLCEVGTAWRMLKNFPLKLFMHPHPSLNSRHHFLTFSSSASSPYPSTIYM